MDFQISIDRRQCSESEMRVLTVAEGTPTAFRRVVGWLPCRVVEEHAQALEVVGIQILMLSPERRQ